MNILCITCVVIFGSASLPNLEAKRIVVDERNFTQILDHFDNANNATWLQRYYLDEKYQNNATKDVVFLLVGGEKPIQPIWMVGAFSLWYDLANQTQALLFNLEHRFYGKSQPFQKMTTENLRYLSSKQAVQDIVNFITTMNKVRNLSPNVKWIVFGGSYGGSLAAWLKLKHPDLVYGVVSSSALLKAELDYNAFYEAVVANIKNHDGCLDAIIESFDQLDQVLESDLSLVDLKETLTLCDTFNETNKRNSLDIATLYSGLANNFGFTSQNNKAQSGHHLSIAGACGIMKYGIHVSALQRLAVLNAKILTEETTIKCLDSNYESLVKRLQNTSLDSLVVQNGTRQWLYQRCTEFGFFPTSSKVYEVFSDRFPVDYYVQLCKDTFNSSYNENFIKLSVNATNILYQGLDLDISNAIFIQGSVDPWHTVGITEQSTKNSTVIFIEGEGHCADMYSENFYGDSEQLKAAKQTIRSQIYSWLGLENIA